MSLWGCNRFVFRYLQQLENNGSGIVQWISWPRVPRSLEIPRLRSSGSGGRWNLSVYPLWVAKNWRHVHWDMKNPTKVTIPWNNDCLVNIPSSSQKWAVIFTTRICSQKNRCDVCLDSYSVEKKTGGGWPVGHRKLLKEAARDAIQVLWTMGCELLILLGMVKRGSFCHSCRSSVFSRYQ